MYRQDSIKFFGWVAVGGAVLSGSAALVNWLTGTLSFPLASTPGMTVAGLIGLFAAIFVAIPFMLMMMGYMYSDTELKSASAPDIQRCNDSSELVGHSPPPLCCQSAFTGHDHDTVPSCPNEYRGVPRRCP